MMDNTARCPRLVCKEGYRHRHHQRGDRHMSDERKPKACA